MQNLKVKALSGTFSFVVLGMVVYVSACFSTEDKADCGCDVSIEEHHDAGHEDAGE
jgi:hypothetical protein